MTPMKILNLKKKTALHTVHIDPDDRPQDVMDKITNHIEKLQR